MKSSDPADALRQSALQTANTILALQRRADEEIRALNKALRQRTEELERQTELAREHARRAEVFRIAFDSSGSGMLLMTPDLRIARVNPAFCEFLGYSREELGAMGLADIVLPEELAATRGGVERLLRGEQSALHLEQRHRHRSGRAVWGSISGAVVHDADGAALYVVLQVQDITGRKQAEAENRQLEGQLLQAQKMEALGTLAGGVAHDFNNILAAILSNAELLQSLSFVDDAQAEAVREIREAAARGAELVRQILTFSRRSEQRLAPIRIETILQSSLRMLRAALPASIEIRSELAEGGPLCMADATQIQQLLTNLATNAWHAMEASGGVMSVSLSYATIDPATARDVPNLRPGPHARIRVTDTGEGMDEETLGHIFEPFFTTKPPGKGTGLGLSVVYGIVHGHGGVVRVWSAKGRGSTFEVLLPTVQEQAASPAAEGAGARPGTGERVLVIDDEPALASVLAKLLGRLGYAARGTSSSEEALTLLADVEYELVIVDYNMPGLNGVELARRMRTLRPGLPMLMMSGYTAPVDPAQIVELGIREVLQKPIARAELAEKVRRALLGRR